MLPAPAPFKIFVVLAGVAGISTLRFSAAILIGRGLRYLILGTLAYEFGDRAIAYLKENGTAVSLAIVVALCGGLTAYVLAKRFTRRTT
jgi:membrane protein YqaA with SNARE-associated domain